MTYQVTVATTVLYDVTVEAESFNHAAEKAVDRVRTEDLDGKLYRAALDIVPGQTPVSCETVVTGISAKEDPVYA